MMSDPALGSDYPAMAAMSNKEGGGGAEEIGDLFMMQITGNKRAERACRVAEVRDQREGRSMDRAEAKISSIIFRLAMLLSMPGSG